MILMYPIPNADLRARARGALKPILPIALLVSLCAELPSLISQVAASLTEQPLMDAAYQYIAHPDMDPSVVISMFTSAITPVMAGAWGLALIAFLLTPFLNLGRLNFTLKLLRGEEVDVSDVLSRSSIFLKAIGQTLILIIKEILWGLPGVAVSLVGVALVFLNPTAQSLNMMMGFYSIGTIVTMVLMIRAALHYSMASLIMADNPETGIFASIRQSIDIMRNRKMLYLSLLVSFIGWILAQSIAETILTGISPIIGMTLGMAIDLLLSVYIQTSGAAFYEAYKAQP